MANMLADCGMVLEYDLEWAQAYFDWRGLRKLATPEYLFDKGCLSWQGLAAGDHEVNAGLHRRLAPLIGQDLNLCLMSVKAEWIAHVAGLKPRVGARPRPPEARRFS